MRKVYSLLKLREEKEKFNKIHLFTRVEGEILDVFSLPHTVSKAY